MNTFIIVQLLGTISLGISVAMMLQRKKENLLICSCMAFVFLAIQYFLTGKTTGAIIAIIIVTRSLIYFYYKKKGLKPALFILVVFTAIQLVSGYFTWLNILSILPLFGGIITGWGLWQDNMKYTRRTLFLARISFIIYNFAAGMYTAMLASTVEMVAVAVAMWKYDRKKKEN